jgi:adenylyltransferase/sulfurtransferase
MSSFEFSHAPLDTQALHASLQDPASGGYASFEGWVRDFNEGRQVQHLEYEAYEALAKKEGERIVQEAITRFGVRGARCVHRIGDLRLGELAVWVGVSAAHRGEAFAACRHIIDEIKHRVPIWKKEHYTDGNSGWVNCERCAAPTLQLDMAAHDHEHHHGEHHRALSSSTHHESATTDYSRQVALADVGAEGQKKIRSARVLVIGAGGLGAPVLSYLTGAGVGVIGIMDSDQLEASNLHRQTLYALQDVGRPKALLAAERLRALNPDVDVRPYVQRATIDTLQAIAAGFDVLVDCSDNFSTRFLINDVAVTLHKKAVIASVYQYEGQIQVIEPGSACLRCVWPEATRDGLVGNCAEAGVLGPVPGVLGAIQALEVLKIILQASSPAEHAVVLFDLQTLQTRRLRVTRSVECPAHCHQTNAVEHATDLRTNAQNSPEVASLEVAQARGLVIIDLRDHQEVLRTPLPVAHRHIPLAQLLDDSSVLSVSGGYLLVCAKGMRSSAAVSTLRQRGHQNTYSLVGGIAGLLTKEP